MGWNPPLGHGAYMVGRQRVTRAEFKRAINHQRSGALRRIRGARGRKRSILTAFPLEACEHEFSYQEDTVGDYGVINGTYTERWLECDHCGTKRPASYEDQPSYDDYH